MSAVPADIYVKLFERTGLPPRGLLVLQTLSCLCLVAATTGAAFKLHLNLSAAVSIELLLVVLVALQLGFFQATIVSCSAVLALNYLFAAPIFGLTVADPQNWISLATFEATSLIVSGLSSKARNFAAEAKLQTLRSNKLTNFSRAILLINGTSQIPEQLCSLIRETIQVRNVQLVVFPRRSLNVDRGFAPEPALPDDSMDYVGNVARRTLRIGTRAIGTLILSGWENEASLADAVASLAAIAIERARAVQEESRAEGERDTEKLRAAVLDGLAHGYKTPLTAIQTASSGLLAIGGADPTQMELITIVDEQATLLNTLTTKLLKTASLESRQVRLCKTDEVLGVLIQRVIEQYDHFNQARLQMIMESGGACCRVDAELVTLALSQLVDNALKYSDIGTVVRVLLTQTPEESTVTVESVGTPILPQEEQKIFERFYRGSNSIGGPTGTGLGLSIVSKAAAAHDGRVSVHIDGRQSSFSFTVPHRG